MEKTAARLFIWRTGYLLGMEDIDDQHRSIFRIASLLADMVARSAKPAEIAPHLSELSSRMRAHFDQEERLMAEVGTAGYGSHRGEHGRVLALVGAAAAEVAEGKPGITRTLLEALDEWLRSHIVGADRVMAAELRSRSEGSRQVVGSRR